MTAHDYARSLADKGTPLSAISRATGLSIEDIGYLRPVRRVSFSVAVPEPEQEPVKVKPPVSSAAALIRTVAAKYGLNVPDMKGEKKSWKYSHPRQEVMYELFTKCPHLSTTRIGAILGGRDHTTVLHGVRAHAHRVGSTYKKAMAERVALAEALDINLNPGGMSKAEKRRREAEERRW